MCSLICLRRFEIEKMLKSLTIPKIVKSAIFHVLLRKNVTNKIFINRCRGQYWDYLFIHEDKFGGFRVTFWDNRSLLSKKHVFGRKWPTIFFLQTSKYWDIDAFEESKEKKWGLTEPFLNARNWKFSHFSFSILLRGFQLWFYFRIPKKALNYTWSSR